jgi:methionine-rich copper-binding protein CopC
MDPPEGSTITRAPRAAALRYSAPVEVRELRIELPDGRTIELDTSATPAAVMSYELPAPFEAGTATLRWSVPQADGHVIEYDRRYEFTDSAIDPRARATRIAMHDVATAMRSALATLMGPTVG